MKKFIPFVICLCLCVTALFAGCSEQVITFEMPDAQAQVASNGGNVVVKGDMVYFIGGYEKYDTATRAKTNVETSALYVAKINQNGEFENIQKFVNSVCGYDYGSLYIVGDEIVYATPELNKDGTGKVRNDIVNIMKMKLDGTNARKVCSLEGLNSTSWWKLIEGENETCLVVYAGSKLDKYTLGEKSATKTEIIKENLLGAIIDGDVVIASVSAKSENSLTKTGNIIKKYEILNGNKETTLCDYVAQGKTVTLKHFENNRLIYVVDGNTYCYNLETDANTLLFAGEFSQFVVEGEEIVFKCKDNDNYYLTNFSTNFVNADAKIYEDKDATVVALINGYAYFTKNNDVFKKSVSDKDEAAIKIEGVGKANTALMEDYDIANGCFFLVTKQQDKTAETICMISANADAHVFAIKDGVPSFKKIETSK